MLDNDKAGATFFSHIKKCKTTIICVSVILLAALISLIWFGGNYLLSGTDLIFPPDRASIFLQTFSMWDHRSLGSSNPRMLAWLFPNGAFLGFSELIGLSLINAEKIWYYFLFAFSGISMYYLTTTRKTIMPTNNGLVIIFNL